MDSERTQSDSPHRFRLKGAKAEDFLESLATKSFFVDWCFRNPRLPDGRELCDFLVIFDDVAIVWQVKDLVLDEHGRYKPAEVEKNVRQLSGARRQLAELKTPIQLENARRSKEALDPSTIKEMFLISALLGKGEDVFPMVEHIGLQTVHVFTRGFTEIVLNELDTISDFIQYLRAKEHFLAAYRGDLLLLGGEENLLAYYLLNDHSFDRLTPYNMVTIEDGHWQGFLSNPRVVAKKAANRISYAWDSIIDRAHEGSSRYEQVARELARPNRLERRSLAQSFYDSHVAAHEDTLHPIFRRITVGRDPNPVRHTTYCFLFMEEAAPRKRRQDMLQAMCIVARDRFPENLWVIGVATEKHFRPTCSYDFVLLHYPVWPEEMKKIATRLREEHGIFKDPVVTESSHDEYPDPT
jgi:hypothetical protein